MFDSSTSLSSASGHCISLFSQYIVKTLYGRQARCDHREEGTYRVPCRNLGRWRVHSQPWHHPSRWELHRCWSWKGACNLRRRLTCLRLLWSLLLVAVEIVFVLLSDLDFDIESSLKGECLRKKPRHAYTLSSHENQFTTAHKHLKMRGRCVHSIIRSYSTSLHFKRLWRRLLCSSSLRSPHWHQDKKQPKHSLPIMIKSLYTTNASFRVRNAQDDE